jgi:hypothetical protein
MFRWSFRSRARHPLIRLLAVVLGAAALLVLFAFGVFAVAALAVGGAALLLVNALRAPASPRAAPAAAQAPPGVIEGEFKVVRETQAQR